MPRLAMGRRLATLAAAALVLSGCAGPDATTAGEGTDSSASPTVSASATESATSIPPETPTASPTETPAETSTTSATASPTAPSEPGLAIGDTGLGDLVIGERVPGNSELVAWSPTGCWDGDGLYAPRAATEESIPFSVVTHDYEKTGVIDSIIVSSPSIETAAGIHPGSTRDELEAAYPDFAAVYKTDKRETTTDMYVLENDVAQTVFEVVHAGSGDSFNPAIKDETVAWIVVEDSANKAHSIAGGDFAGPCPG